MSVMGGIHLALGDLPETQVERSCEGIFPFTLNVPRRTLHFEIVSVKFEDDGRGNVLKTVLLLDALLSHLFLNPVLAYESNVVSIIVRIRASKGSR